MSKTNDSTSMCPKPITTRQLAGMERVAEEKSMRS